MRRIAPLLLFLQIIVLGGCSSIDCQLNSTVHSKYVLAGPVSILDDTLSVIAHREGKPDTLLLNKLIYATDFIIPMSYTQPVDVLYFTLTDDQSVTRTDTVRISKTDQAHFESIDCTPTYFHTLTGAEWTSHAIDSIIITNSKVTYDTTGGHLRIYFKSRD